MEKETEYWEVPEIDLNFRHYSGNPSDVIKKVKTSIATYLTNKSICDESRKIYSAIYNALNYYKDISYLPSAEYGTGDTFLSCSLKSFNEDYRYLSEKYNSKDSSDSPVITFSGRIKSPLSFLDKVKEKITEYLEDGIDLTYLNESLRDLIGMRVVVDPPAEIKAQGPQAESDFLYKVFYDLATHRGLKVQDPRNQDYRFSNVNTRHDPQKQEQLKGRASQTGFAPSVYNDDGTLAIYIPAKRIPEIEDIAVDSILKDYNMSPKYSGYQSLHTCVVPSFSDTIDRLPTPHYVIPSANSDYYFEYQFRTKAQDDFAERGPASHVLAYKPNREVYHRLSVPFYLDFDSLEDSSQTVKPEERKIKLRNFSESFKKFYGFSFESFFGISFKKFRDLFSHQERDEILARTKIIEYDKENDLYTLHDAPKTIIITPEELPTIQTILANKDKSKLLELAEKFNIADCAIPASEHPKNKVSRKIEIYVLDSSDGEKEHSEVQALPKEVRTVPDAPDEL